MKRGHNGYSQMLNYFKNEEISFDSIHSFRYVEKRFTIVPILIGGGVRTYFFSKGDFTSFYFGTMLAYALGLSLSVSLKFSEELFLSNDGWSISDE